MLRIKKKFLANRYSINRELIIITACRNKLEYHENCLRALLKKERELILKLPPTYLEEINHDERE